MMSPQSNETHNFTTKKNSNSALENFDIFCNFDVISITIYKLDCTEESMDNSWVIFKIEMIIVPISKLIKSL